MVLLGATLLIDGIQNLCTVLYTVKVARDIGERPDVIYITDPDE